MWKWIVIAALAVLAALAAVTGAGVRAVPRAELPPLSADLPQAEAEQERCAAAIDADGREAARRLATGEDPGASFAARNDQFRSTWLVSGLQLTDPSRDWRARVDALSARMPDAAHSPALSALYVKCLEGQNRDPTFTAALHSYLPYRDEP